VVADEPDVDDSWSEGGVRVRVDLVADLEG